MRSKLATAELPVLAANALRALLGRASAIKLKEMRREVRAEGGCVEILADTDVFGHSHVLACGVHAAGEAHQLREVLHVLCNDAASIAEDATPVLIAPYLSPEAQQLCIEHNAGFLDFEGNGRLTIGEVFIRVRSLPGQSAGAATAQRARPARSSSHRSLTRRFSTDQVAVPIGA